MLDVHQRPDGIFHQAVERVESALLQLIEAVEGLARGDEERVVVFEVLELGVEGGYEGGFGAVEEGVELGGEVAEGGALLVEEVGEFEGGLVYEPLHFVHGCVVFVVKVIEGVVQVVGEALDCRFGVVVALLEPV